MSEHIVTVEQIEALVKRAGGQAELASEIGTTQPTVSRWLNGSQPRGALLSKLLTLVKNSGLSEDAELARRTVPLIGYVSAGGALTAYATDQGEYERVLAPDGSTEATVAVEIRGQSLGEFFEHWRVFYDDVRRPLTDDLIGELCVVGLEDGRVMIKKIKRGGQPGRYHLHSLFDAPIYDQEIEWAAPVKFLAPRN